METQNSFIAWIALTVSIVALILGWVAFNRSGTDVEVVIQERVDEATVELRLEYEQLEAEFRSFTANQLRERAEDVNSDEDDETATTTP